MQRAVHVGLFLASISGGSAAAVESTNKSQLEDTSFELEMMDNDGTSEPHQLAEISPHASKKLIRHGDQPAPASAMQASSEETPNVPYWAQYRISQMTSVSQPVAAAAATAPVVAAQPAPPQEDQPEVAAPVATGAVAPEVAKPPVVQPAVVAAPEPLAVQADDAAPPNPVAVPAAPKNDIKPASNQSLSAPQAIFNSTVATAANATGVTHAGKVITAKGAVVSIFLGFLVTMFFLSALVVVLNAGQRENMERAAPEKEPPRPTPSYRQLLKAQQQSESAAASSNNPRVV